MKEIKIFMRKRETGERGTRKEERGKEKNERRIVNRINTTRKTVEVKLSVEPSFIEKTGCFCRINQPKKDSRVQWFKAALNTHC